MTTLLLVLGALAIAALLAFFIAGERRRRAALLKALEGPFNGSARGRAFKGSYAGLPFELRFSSDGDNFYDRMRVSLIKPAGYKLFAAPRGSKARASSLLRGLAAVESGDKTWDGAYYAASDDARRALGFLGSKACREALPGLFALGYDNFYSDGERLEISRTYWHDAEALKPEPLLKAAALLAAAAAGLN